MRFIIFLILACSTSLAFSQESGAPKFGFRTLAIGQNKFPELWVMDSGKPVAIAFASSQPSAPLTGDKTSPLKIFKGPLNDKGLPTDATPSQVPLPTGSSILLLGWMEGDKPGFRAVEDPFATMKRDDWMVINTSASQLAVQVGENAKPVTIKASSTQEIKISAPVNTGAATTIAVQQPDKSWKSIYSSYLPVRDDIRGLIVISQKETKFRVNFITDKIGTGTAVRP